MNLRDRIAIVGVGETEYVRRSPRPFKDLQMEAVHKALADAGLRPEEVDGIVTEGVTMPKLFPLDEMAANLGSARAFSATISQVGAGIVAAPLLAAMAIASGQANVVLSYFGVDWGSARGGPYAFHEAYPPKISFEMPFGYFGQPQYFATVAHRAMHEYGLTERQLGMVGVVQRRHAILNGHGQNMKPMSIEDYFQTPLVATPLRYPDCCLITDGAAAFVMTSVERAKDLRKPPVYVSGVAFAAHWMDGNSFLTQNPEYLEMIHAREASRRAMEMAGVGIEEIDFAEVYDCFSMSLLIQLESIGFVKLGEAGPFVEAGHTAIGGRLPTNTHGGLLSHAYVLGINHVVEAVRQLRGEAGAAQVENAEVGLVGGLNSNEYGTLILRKA